LQGCFGVAIVARNGPSGSLAGSIRRGGHVLIDVKQLPFDVTDFDVTVAEGVKIKWQGREVDSGPISIKLGEPGSHGVIDYETGKVNVEFRVRLSFPELAEILDDMGADPSLTKPIDTVIRSEGALMGDDHSLRLWGKGQVKPNRLLDPLKTLIGIRAPSF
jgi:hypothetical protein